MESYKHFASSEITIKIGILTSYLAIETLMINNAVNVEKVNPLHDHLSMRKICSNRVLRFLSSSWICSVASYQNFSTNMSNVSLTSSSLFKLYRKELKPFHMKTIVLLRRWMCTDQIVIDVAIILNNFCVPARHSRIHFYDLEHMVQGYNRESLDQSVSKAYKITESMSCRRNIFQHRHRWKRIYQDNRYWS